ncbi:MAG: ribbon-helix-helix domain-containing protein [Lachnospiraceae bacterium]|nr:ribbon-helix-helix domain-containing protein [Lachnospiraceae bacterium]
MSPRTGRPKADNPKAIKYSIRIDEETEKRLVEYCEANGITKGKAIRQAINLLLDNKK